MPTHRANRANRRTFDYVGLLIWGLLFVLALWSAIFSYRAYTTGGNFIDGAFFWLGIAAAILCAFLTGLSIAKDK